MTNLECNVKNCYYNKSSKCCRDGINVEGQDATVIDATYCGDFKEKTEGATAQACHCSAGPEDTLDVSAKLRIVYLMIILSAMRTKLQFQVMEQSMKARQNVEALNVVVSRINLFFCNCASTYKKIEL